MTAQVVSSIAFFQGADVVGLYMSEPGISKIHRVSGIFPARWPRLWQGVRPRNESFSVIMPYFPGMPFF